MGAGTEERRNKKMGTPRGNQEKTKRVHTTRAKGSNFLQVKGKESFVKIESVTAEILLTLSLCGWWWWVVVVKLFSCKTQPLC